MILPYASISQIKKLELISGTEGRKLYQHGASAKRSGRGGKEQIGGKKGEKKKEIELKKCGVKCFGKQLHTNAEDSKCSSPVSQTV